MKKITAILSLVALFFCATPVSAQSGPYSSPKAVINAFNKAAKNGNAKKMMDFIAVDLTSDITESQMYKICQLVSQSYDVFGGLESWQLGKVVWLSDTEAKVYETDYFVDGTVVSDWTYVILVDGEWLVDWTELSLP